MNQITQSFHEYIVAHPKLRFTFFGGKGGVGKTVMAGVTALQLARQGNRTILASTNPVHSLSGLLGQDVYGKPTPVAGADKLWAYEIDTKETIERLQARHQAEDRLVPEVRRDIHAGRRVRRSRHHESRLRGVRHVRKHGGLDVQGRV